MRAIVASALFAGGIAALSAGAWLFHPGAGLLTLGAGLWLAEWRFSEGEQGAELDRRRLGRRPPA